MSHRSLRIVKLGGSLLDFPELPHAFSQWYRAQRPAQTVVIAGGGAWVESVRETQRRFPLSDAFCHDLSVGLLKTTAQLVASLLRKPCGAQWVGEWEALRDRLDTESAFNPLVFAPDGFLMQIEPTMPAPRLPRDWRSTSDSIAARLATCLDARELVLLKSCPRPRGDLHELARVGFVDRVFPRVARSVRAIRFVNLRADRWAS